ncbi:RrF2 family transcriptional regulator [Culicoidibacter larvae]|uniref:Rrf2 family transcriptional regulator n=1 Tax=Culicoidibacter larvae TaxID=2579976 RepID=A0A5R8QDY2_9FIRM|nr:Rrf2 family transcriptional regulator [Culicoidibacter larvae]TLG75398.1 Rrf2 family transcriptional regulator [Culicoidibacter larvae]
MQFSIGVEYALHSLFYMMEIPGGKRLGVKDIAQLHGVSETYLAKIFTKLKKGGIVRSVTGVKGGYELARTPEEISFWDVVEAIEGPSYMFQCAEIRQKNVLFADEYDPKIPPKCPCLIKVVMVEAENQMRNYLKDKSLQWLQDELYQDFSKEKQSKIRDWAGQAN